MSCPSYHDRHVILLGRCKSHQAPHYTVVVSDHNKIRKFRVCKSVHHHTFKWINQPDASISHIYCSSFKCSSTCFGHPLAHHQELINCSSRLWFTYCHKRYCFVNLQLRKDKGYGYCSCWASDDGREDVRNMLSCKYTSSNKLEILLHQVG
jgi:hypothetical protein